MNNNGFQIETDIMNMLNGKQVKDLSNNAYNMVKVMFGRVDPESLVESALVDGFQKADISVTVNGITKYVSIKSSRAEVVHQEHIKTFVAFLRESGISKETLKTILLFHFGDGTLDGTGTERMDHDTIMFRYKHDIQEANYELNCNKEFIMKCMDRFIFKGTENQSTAADFIYHGNAEFGVLINRNQLQKHIERRTWGFIRNPHIGQLHFRPHARYSGKEVRNPEYLFKVDIYWINMFQDVDYIATRYDT